MGICKHKRCVHGIEQVVQVAVMHGHINDSVNIGRLKKIQSFIDSLAIRPDLLILVIQFLQKMKIIQNRLVSAFGQRFADAADDTGNRQSPDVFH